MIWMMLLACGKVGDADALAELDDNQAAKICFDAADNTPMCGTDFDVDACAADVMATPTTCPATVADWRACRDAWDALACDNFDVPDACAYTLDEACLLEI